MRIPLFAVAAALALASPALRAEWLLAAYATHVVPGQPLKVSVARDESDNRDNGDGGGALPDRLEAVIETGTQRIAVELVAVAGDARATFRRDYLLSWPAGVAGSAILSLADRRSTRLMLVARQPEAPGADLPVADARTATSAVTSRSLPALSVNEPMYFLVGAGADTSARIQLSFKYRIFDPESAVVELLPPLRGLYFGYTQTSLWDLGSDSRPFRDTSYRPSLFYEWQMAAAPDSPHAVGLRAGYEHESNGRDGASSRSIDTLFARLDWRYRVADGHSYIGVMPKVWVYLDREDNPDIAHYRGYGDIEVRFGQDDGWLTRLRLRRGTSGVGSTQLDVSYPLTRAILSGTAAYLHFQVFNGYGETLLDYNRSRGTQYRIGFSIER